MRRTVRTLTTALLPTLIGLYAVAASIDARTMPPQGGWTTHGAIGAATAADTASRKPVNRWTADTLTAAGWEGCVPSARRVAPGGPWPVAHVVRLPAAEGFGWTRMTARDVAARLDRFGGTPTLADDVVVVANCY